MPTATATRPAEGGGKFGRTNSVQRMLDLERKIKIEKMKANPPPIEPRRPPRSFPIAPRGSRQVSRDSSRDAASPRVETRQNSMPSHPPPPEEKEEKETKKSNTLPTLRITVPPIPHTKPEVPKEKPQQKQPTAESGTQKTVTFLSAGREEDQESDAASSICQSPSWENWGQKKKKDRKEKDGVEKEARHAKKGSATKLTKPPPPPSASRTPFLAQRQATAPLPLGHQSKQERGRSSSSSERDGTDTTSSPESKSKRPKHQRARSTSLTNRIRSSIEIMRGDMPTERELATGFIGGLKLQQEREAAAQRASMPPRATTFTTTTTAERPVLAPIQQPPSSSSSTQPPKTPEALGDSRPGSNQSTQSSSEKPDSSSTSHRLRHKAAPIGQRTSSLGSQALVSPTAPPVPDLPASWANGRRIGTPSQEHTNEKPSSRGSGDSRRQGAKDQGYFSHIPDTKKREPNHDGPNKVNKASNDDSALPLPRPGFPPSTAYSNISADFCSSPISLKSNGQTASPATTTEYLGTLDRQYTPPSLDLRSPASDTRSNDGRKDRRVSTIRTIRDAALGVFNRRSSRAASPSGELSSGRSSRVVSPSEYGTHGSSLSPKAARVLGAVSEQPARPRAPARPSDRSSISSYDDSTSQPSSVTTPDSSRPQSEKGSNGASNDTEKALGADEKPTPTSQDAGFDFPTIATPPLGPKSSRRPLSGKYEAHESPEIEKSEGDLWTRATMAMDMERPSLSTTELPPSNLSHISLIPEPLAVSPRSSLEEQDKQSATTGKPNTSAKVESEPNCTIKRNPSIPKSRSSPDLQLIDTSFLPKLKHQPLQPRQAKHNSTLPVSLVAQDTASPKAAVGRANPASYLEEARRSAPAAKAVRFKGRGGAMVDSRHGAEPIAKMFVECCSCKFYHDMPSRLYECMVNPEGTIEDKELGVHGVVTRCVKCPWCAHGMTTQCCAGYAAVVYMKERLH